MDAVDLLRAGARNNAFSNHRLLTACAALTDVEWRAERTGFFPSIAETWNHILVVDWFYVSAVEENPLDPAKRAEAMPCPVFADLDREQRAVDRRLIAFCEALQPDDLDRRTDQVRDWGTVREPIDKTLMHLFQHQVHHRGQIHAMLSSTDVPPPQLDEYFLDMDADLRAGDLAALGLREDGT